MASFTGLKILYGLFELPLAAIEIFLRLYLFIHFTEVVKLPPWMTGLALLVSLASDAALAPWIGAKSDAWFGYGRGRWPWALGGALVAGLALLAMFQIPAGTEPHSAFALLVLLMLVLNTGLVFANVPYAALIGDVAEGEPESYLGWRVAFGGLGQLAGLAIPGFFIALKDPLAFKQSAWILTILLFLLGFVSSMSRPAFRPRRGTPIDPDFAVLTTGDFLRARPFPAFFHGATLWLFAIAVLNVAVTFALSVSLPYYKLSLRLEENITQGVLLTSSLFAIAAIPLWLLLYRRWGPRRAFLASGLPWAALTALSPLILGLGEKALLYLYGGVLLGIFTASTVIWEWWFVANARRVGAGLGAAYGLWRMMSRLARAFGTALAGLALSWAGIQGFDPRIDDRLALIYGPVVGIGILLALWLAYGNLKRSET